MFDLPSELLLTICCYVDARTLCRLRQACREYDEVLAGDETMSNSLRVPGAEWWRLKDVSLAAKYKNHMDRHSYMPWHTPVRLAPMGDTHHVSPPDLRGKLDTLDDLAFWGTLADVQTGRIVCTIAPHILKVRAALHEGFTRWHNPNTGWHNPTLMWHSANSMEYTWLDPDAEARWMRDPYELCMTTGRYPNHFELTLYTTLKDRGWHTFTRNIVARTGDINFQRCSLSFVVAHTKGLELIIRDVPDRRGGFFGYSGIPMGEEAFSDVYQTALKPCAAFVEHQTACDLGWNQTRFMLRWKLCLELRTI